MEPDFTKQLSSEDPEKQSSPYFDPEKEGNEILAKNLDIESKVLNERIEEQDSPLRIYSENIKISVCNPILKEGITKHIEYTVDGVDPNTGAYNVSRRFNDFVHLREALVTRWPGCFVPQIPPKKSTGNLEAKFVEERRQGLDDFCRNIANLKYLYNSDEFKLFISAHISDVEKAMANLPKQSNEDLLEKYKRNFEFDPEVKGEMVGVHIDEFENFIKKVKGMYLNFSEMARNCAESRKYFNEHFLLLYNFLMPEYEKNCLNEYVDFSEPKLIFSNRNNNNISALLHNAKSTFDVNSYNRLCLKLNREQRDIDAINEAISIKKKYTVIKEKTNAKLDEFKADLQKILSAGKGTNSKGQKTEAVEKLEKNIANTEKEFAIISNLCDYIYKILGSQILQFKELKTTEYFSILKLFTESEVRYARAMEELWKELANNMNVISAENHSIDN